MLRGIKLKKLSLFVSRTMEGRKFVFKKPTTILNPPIVSNLLNSLTDDGTKNALNRINAHSTPATANSMRFKSNSPQQSKPNTPNNLDLNEMAVQKFQNSSPQCTSTQLSLNQININNTTENTISNILEISPVNDQKSKNYKPTATIKPLQPEKKNFNKSEIQKR